MAKVDMKLRDICKIGSVLLSILILPYFTFAQGKEGDLPAAGRKATTQEPTKQDNWKQELEDKLGIKINGEIGERLRHRWTSDDADQDFYQYLFLNMDYKDKIAASLYGRLSVDTNGSRDHSNSYTFDSIEDTYNDNVNGRLYYAYLDIKNVGPSNQIRLGRQFTYDTLEMLQFDGGRLEFSPIKSLYQLKLDFYGGIPVHQFESSPEGDYLMGTGAEMMPCKYVKIRGEYMRVKDDFLYSDNKNDLVGLQGWLNLNENISLYGKYTNLDGNNREGQVRATFTLPEYDFIVQGSIFRLFETEKDISIDLDRFNTFLRQYYPYVQYSVLFSKGLGKQFHINGGVDIRDLWDKNKEADYNHEFSRFYITPTISAFPFKNSDLSLTGEIWDSQTDNKKISTFGVEFSQKCAGKLKTTIGTYYSLFKYDILTDVEKDGVRTGYIKIDANLRKDLKASFGYEIEKDDFDTYGTLNLGLKYSF